MAERALVLDRGKKQYQLARDRLLDRVEFIEVTAGADVPSFSPDPRTLAALDAVMARTPFRHVIATSESDVAFAGSLRSRYGLAGLDAEQAAVVTNKWRMKQAVRRHYPAAAAWLSGEFLALRHPRPAVVVVKPLSGSLARGVRRLPLGEALPMLAASDELMLVEEALEADGELHCDGLVRDGRLEWVVVSAYDRPVLIGSGTLGSLHLPQDDASADARPDAVAAVRRILAAFPFADFVFHLELLEVEGELVFGEIGMRPGGGGITQSIGRCHGPDLWLEFLGLQAGIRGRLSPLPRSRDDLCGVVHVAPPVPADPSAAAPWATVEQMLRLPGVTAVESEDLASGNRPASSRPFSHFVIFEGVGRSGFDTLIGSLSGAREEAR